MYLIALLIFFVLLFMKKYNYILLLQLMMLVSIPDNNDNIAAMLHRSLGKFDAGFLLSVLMILVLMVKSRCSLKKTLSYIGRLWTGVILAAAAIAAAGCAVGYLNHNIYLVTVTRGYVFYTLIAVAFVWWLNHFNHPFRMVLNYFIASSSVFTVFTLICYFWRHRLLPIIYAGMPDGAGNALSSRITFPNNTMLMVTIMIAFLLLYTARGVLWRCVYGVVILTQLFSVVITQNRTLTLSVALLLFALLIPELVRMYRKLRDRKAWLIAAAIAAVAAISAGVSVLLNSNLTIVRLLRERLQDGTASLLSRNYSNAFNMGLVSHPWGRGVGAPLFYLNNLGEIYRPSAYGDNYFVHVFNDFGILGLMLLIFVLGCLIVRCFQMLAKNRKVIYVLLTFALMSANAFYMTSQFIHSEAVFITFIFLCFVIMKKHLLQSLGDPKLSPYAVGAGALAEK